MEKSIGVKNDYYFEYLIGKLNTKNIDKRKFFNYIKSLFFNERYEWSINKYKVFIKDNNIVTQNICKVLVEFSKSDYVLHGKKMKGFLGFVSKVENLNSLQDKSRIRIVDNDMLEFLRSFRKFSNKHLKFKNKKEYIAFIDKNFETGYSYNTLYKYLIDSQIIEVE